MILVTDEMREVSAADGTTFKVVTADISDWTEITHTEDKRNGDLYLLFEKGNPNPIGSLQYLKGFPAPKTLTIRKIDVLQAHQGKGVASAMLQRLRSDWPDYLIDPGVTTEMGQAFTRRILNKEPEAQIALAPTYEGKTVGY